MKYFMVFILVCLTGSLIFWKVDRRLQQWIILGLVLLLTFVLFFLKKI